MDTNQNSIAELVELLLRTVVNTESQEIEVRADLRINTAELDTEDDFSFKVGFKRVWLKLERTGVAITPGGRHGEPMKANNLAIEQTTSCETLLEREASAHASATTKVSASSMQAEADLNIGVDAKGSAKERKTVSTKTSESTPHIRVKARPSEQWEVSETQGALDGTYLNNDLLCRVVAMDRANSLSVELCALAKQKDLVLDVTHNGAKFKFLSNTQEKMLKILIGKALSAAGSRHAGTITFSRSESEIEK